MKKIVCILLVLLTLVGCGNSESGNGSGSSKVNKKIDENFSIIDATYTYNDMDKEIYPNLKIQNNTDKDCLISIQFYSYDKNGDKVGGNNKEVEIESGHASWVSNICVDLDESNFGSVKIANYCFIEKSGSSYKRTEEIDINPKVEVSLNEMRKEK